MLLGVMWMMTALVTGFMVGRISMYGMWESEEEQENRDPEGDGRLRIWRRRRSEERRVGKECRL